MKFLVTTALALVLLSVEAVLVRSFGFEVTHIDVTLVLVVFLGLRASTLEGAFSSFAVGYLLDVFTGRPMGLFPFLAVLTFLLIRVAAAYVDARSRVLFVLLVAAATFGHGVLATLLWRLVSRAEGGALASMWGLPGQVLLTALAAMLLWPLLRRLDPGQERPQAGVLL
jgi:hypothetical protein